MIIHRSKRPKRGIVGATTTAATATQPPQPTSIGRPVHFSGGGGGLTLLPALLLLLAVILALAGAPSVLLVAGFPSGAPESACKTLKPGHGGEPSSGASPFELTQDKLQVEPGDQIKVTLSSPSKITFKGLLVQAVNEKGDPVGKFLAGTGLKLLESCSAVTHSDREPKKTATLVWEAPADLKSKEMVTFKGTVVHKFDEYYMNIKSTLGAASGAKRRR